MIEAAGLQRFGMELHHGPLHVLIGQVAERVGFQHHPVGFRQRNQRTDARQVDGLIFQRSPQSGIERETGSHGERRRFGKSGSIQKVQQRSMLLVDLDQAVFHFAERGIEDDAQNAPLVVLEKRGQGVRAAAKEAIDQANHFGQIRLRDRGAAFLLEVVKGGEVLRRGAFHRGGHVMIAEMQRRKGNLLRLFREVGGDTAAPNGEA